MNAGALTLAYHGCDATVRDDLVVGRLKGLKPSTNPYDWLGEGVYFFEGDPLRAELFASASHEDPSKHYTRQPIATPAVVGAILCVSNWLDMTTQAGQRHYRSAYQDLLLATGEQPMPENKPAHENDIDVLDRQLDRSVINMMHSLRSATPLETPPFQAVRGAFYQGAPLAPSSEFRERTHVQIALKAPECVMGWFLVPGDRLMTPLERDEAEAKLSALKLSVTAAKKRVKVPR